MGIMDMPNEVLLDIIINVHHDDVSALLRSCKAISALVKIRLEMLYGTVTLAHKPDLDQRCPLQLLSDISRWRFIAPSVQRLYLDDSLTRLQGLAYEDKYVATRSGKCEELPILTRRLSHFHVRPKRAQDCEILTTRLKQTGGTISEGRTHNTLEKGRLATVLMLLACLPNVAKLRIPTAIFNKKSMTEFLSSDQATHPLAPLLSRLHSVEYYTSHSGIAQPIEHLTTFGILPGMKHLKGQAIRAPLWVKAVATQEQKEVVPIWSPWPGNCTCRLESLEISEGQLSSSQLVKLVRPLRTLKRLGYCRRLGYGSIWSSNELFRGLLDVAGSTLETVLLTDRYGIGFEDKDAVPMLLSQFTVSPPFDEYTSRN